MKGRNNNVVVAFLTSLRHSMVYNGHYTDNDTHAYPLILTTKASLASEGT